ncbi:MAG TPA: HAD hydrolase-like protein [Baekduia sp.]|nr:HAD hydrolase-like protein [Baekduia sp.]
MPDSLSAADAVLFDLDGVLVDSRHAFATSLNAALAGNGLEERPAAELHRFLGPPLEMTMRELVGDDPALVDSCVAAYRGRLREHGPRESRPYDGIPEVVAMLASAMPLAVATSKPQALAEPLLEAFGLAGHFAVIVGPSMEARDEPKAVTIERALRHLPAGASPVMVGDRRYDVIGARAHGLPCAGALWGVGGEEELREAGAAALVAEPRDLVALLGA